MRTQSPHPTAAAISIETALVYSQQEGAAEGSKIEALVVAGAVVDVRPRRSHTAALPRYDPMYGADQPLIAA